MPNAPQLGKSSMNKRALDEQLKSWLVGWTIHKKGSLLPRASQVWAMQLEINDLKTKVLRLTEQYTEHDGKVRYFSASGMSEQVSLIEQQIHRWRYRLPDLSDDSSRERVISTVEVKEDLDKFKDITMEKVREVNNALCALEREFQLFERARDESWEAVSQRVSTLVDSSVSGLSRNKISKF